MGCSRTQQICRTLEEENVAFEISRVEVVDHLGCRSQATGSSRGLAATEKVIKYMAKIDLEAEMEDSKSELDTGMHSDCDPLDESISS